MKFALLLLLALVLNLTACLNNGLATEEQNARVINQVGNGKAVNLKAGKPKSQTTAGKAQPVARTDNNEAKEKLSNVTSQELQELLENHFSNFFLIDSYKPFHLQGDFNGDKNQDIAIVIGAQDRHAETGTLANLAEGLCYAGVDTSFQNMRAGVFLPARPRQNCSAVEGKKALLQTEYSQYGLLIVLSNQEGWREVLKQEAFGQKFLLLDAVFEAENNETTDKTDKLIVVRKSQSKQLQPVDAACLPPAAKGDGIFSGELEAGGKVIYFDGKKFMWTQCGD